MMAADKLWFVRAGESGVYADDFRHGEYVAIGWTELGPNLPIEDREAFDRLLAETYPKESAGTRQAWSAQIRRFYAEPQIGEGVITYDPKTRTYHLGLIDSEVEWRGDPPRRMRRVSWTHHVKRDELSEDTQRLLGPSSTLFTVNENATSELWARASSNARSLPPSGESVGASFWNPCVRLAEIYGQRPNTMSGDTEQFKLSKAMKEGLADLANRIAPSASWLTAASVGIGNWVRHPWVACFDTRETTTAQKGAYFVLQVVSETPARLRLGLGVGLKEYGSNAANRAGEILRELGPEWRDGLLQRGFVGEINPAVELPGFEGVWGMVLARALPIGEVLEHTDALNEDVRLLLGAYKAWVDAKARSEAPRPVIVSTTSGASIARETPAEFRNPETPVVDRSWLEKQTLWSHERLDEVLEAIQTRTPQIILAGPPGTGKTWVAQAIAAFLTGGRAGGYELVQFHPSYSYEEFIEGLRPTASAQGLEFRPVDGLLVRTAKNLPQGLSKVLIVDEINRANLPKVFGELMYLLEYRGKSINLQYSSHFALPEKLLLIGTMNTADRSIRSIDVALRRRFEFFECPPDAEILGRFYADRENEVADLVDGFRKLNERLSTTIDRHHTVGHTFFMAKRMDADLLRKIWKHRIGPLIEEYLFDQPDVAAEFEAGKFWSGV